MEDRRKDENGDEEEEEYIDMELLSTSSPSSSTQQQPTEFEFQMSLTSTTRPPAADELFFNGQLLPLHHPRRHAAADAPLESCRPSCDHDDFFEWSNELNSFIHPIKTPWPKKLKLLKLTSIVALKLKASTTFLRSFFSKTPCSDAIEAGAQVSKIPTIASIMKSIDISEENLQRRSFSGAVKRHSSSASSSGASSSSSSFSLNGSHDQLHCLRRSSSATEIEGSIEAAIAHCKKSHQV